MFASPAASPTNRSPRFHPLSSNLCHPELCEGSAFRLSPPRALSVPTFSSPDLCPFNFKLSTVNCLSPFLATLTDEPQLTENPATLTPVSATLTSRVKVNPFVCHSYKKHLGVEYVRQLSLRQLRVLCVSALSLLSSTAVSCKLLAVSSPLATPNSFRIRTYEKYLPNPFRIRTCKTQDLKSFRIRTYKKTGEGAPSYRRPVSLETSTPNGASLYTYTQERPGGPGTQVLTMRRFLIAIASLAVLPAISLAQARGMMSGMARPAMAASAPHIAMHASQPSGIHVSSSGSHAYAGYPRFVRTRSGAVVPRPAPRAGSPIRNHGSGNSGRPLHSQDIVPGLGFDFPHFAATHPEEGDHERGRNHRFDGAFFPLFFGGGFDMPLFPDDVEDAPPAEAQQVDTRQPEPVQTTGRPGDYEPRQNRPPAAQSVAVATAEPEVESYVFVRRDGTVFFATAFAWENGTLRYITSEGLRHTLTADKLDLDATQQFNEQRGLTFRSPV